MELEIEEKLQLTYKNLIVEVNYKIRNSNKTRIQGRNIRKQI